jgi:hypothetical protein
MRRVKALAISILLLITVASVAALVSGAGWLGVILPSGLPAGNAIAALGLTAPASVAVLFSTADSALRMAALGILCAAVAWLPVSIALAGNLALNFTGWRGPVWINISYMIIRGLIGYGFSEDAADLAFRTIDGVYATHRQTGGIWEFYDAERHDIAELNRKRNERLKQLTLGNKPLPEYGWSALVKSFELSPYPPNTLLARSRAAAP